MDRQAKPDGLFRKMEIKKPYKCEYCGASFTKEKTLSVHMCEKKRRHLQKGEKHVQLGYYAFTRFYKLSAGTKTDKTYEQFCDSPYYNAFVKFGSWLNNVNPLYMERYIDWVVTSGKKLDHWCRDELYEIYVNELVLKESMETAVERTIDTMMSWGEEKEAPWNDYFRHATLNRVTRDIKDGKISPWLMLNCTSGKGMLAQFNDEQLEFVYSVLDPKHWAMKFKKKPADVEVVKEVAKESKL
tara:strand:+ start:2600 stop:3325 length:726 start_codon:yes stop_codon:yes gene_type:complete